MVEGLLRAAEFADLEAASARLGGHEHTRERFGAFAAFLRQLADTELTPAEPTDVRALQTRRQRFWAWLTSL